MTLRRLIALVGALTLAPLAVGAGECDPERVVLLAPSGPVAYDVEIADDPAEQARGLMFRTDLPRDSGMLFVFPRPRQAAFWMKNTPLPLDIVFIDATGRVLNVAARTTPFSEASIASAGDALAVLEVNGGEAERHGYGAGTQVIHPAFAEAPPEHACAP